MKLTEKEKDILESVLYYAKENYYVLWHAGEMKEYESDARIIALDNRNNEKKDDINANRVK